MMKVSQDLSTAKNVKLYAFNNSICNSIVAHSEGCELTIHITTDQLRDLNAQISKNIEALDHYEAVKAAGEAALAAKAQSTGGAE